MAIYTRLKRWLGYIELENLSTGKLVMIMLIPIVIILGVSLLANIRIGSVHISSVVIRGNVLLNDSLVQSMLPANIVGSRVADINPEKLENELTALSAVKNSFIETSIDGKLKIDLFERKPIAIVNDNNGELEFIDNEGIIFNFSDKENYRNLPVLQAEGISGDSVILKEASMIIENFGTFDNGSLLPYLSQLVYSRRTGIFEFITNDNGKRIILGRQGNIAEKLGKFMKFKESELNRTESDKISFVDLRWQGKIITGKL